ncbi:MAG: AEC family transporter [Marinobacter sp.]|nr:AEC family transporter [Marinobacter sp.]
MENFYLILIYLAIGALLRRLPAMPDNAATVLNIYVLYVALPALILKSLPGITLSSNLLIPAITPWILLITMAGIILLLGRTLQWRREEIGALLVIVPLGNTAFLGFPMIDALFGAEAMPYALVYDQLGSFIALATYATIVAAFYSPTMSAPSRRAVILKILTFPSFVALIAALLIRNSTLPPLANTLIDNLSATLVPVVMIAVGYQLSFRFTRSELSPLVGGLTLKLAAMPLLTWVGWTLAGQQGMAVNISVFQAAMPSMISAGAVAIMAGLAPRLVSGVVGLGILISLCTLPLLAWLLQ